MKLAAVQGTEVAARREALSWLARQLRWERTLDELRDQKDRTRRAA